MAQQEHLMKLQLLGQEIKQFEQQLEIIEQQKIELQNLKTQIKILEEAKEKELYAEIGKGIYIKTQLEKKELLIDIGNKIFAPKTFRELYEIIESQKNKFEDVKKSISRKVNEINLEVDRIIKESENEKSKKKK